MDKVSKKKRSWIMSRIRSKSAIEQLPKRYYRLHLRRHPAGIFGHPDFGNKSKKVVLFIDGCFWHCCPQCFVIPKTNVDFWIEKFNRNLKRDGLVNRKLKAAGFRIIRIWEHNL